MLAVGVLIDMVGVASSNLVATTKFSFKYSKLEA